MVKRIVWSANALSDRIQILDYWFARTGSKTYSKKLDKSIKTLIKHLISFPEMGRKVPEADENNIREIIIRPYRIIYQLQESSINIITIVHSARDLSNPKLKKWEIG